MRRTSSRFFIVGAIALLFAMPAHTLTAVCKNPTGRMLGVHGVAFNGKAFDIPDGISNATFTILWKTGDKEAQIVSQSSGGANPTTDRAILVFDTKEQISFLVVYPSAVWLYSIYPSRNILMMTSHNNGASMDVGGAVIKAYKANCEIGE